MTTDAQPALFTENADLELELKVRSGDHDNSWRAAAKLDVPAEHLLKGKLYRLLVEHGPQTHDSLFDLYAADGGTRTIQRVRTSLHEMTMDKKPRSAIAQVPLVRAHERGGISAHGGPSQKWEAIQPEGEHNDPEPWLLIDFSDGEETRFPTREAAVDVQEFPWEEVHFTPRTADELSKAEKA